jgi:hypothetical protein
MSKVKKSISQLPICHLGWLAVLGQSDKTLVLLFALRTVSYARIIDYGTEHFAMYKFQPLEGSFEKGRPDTQLNDIQQNDTKH